jgi:Spy/CpxP family protein refolding chaperone
LRSIMCFGVACIGLAALPAGLKADTTTRPANAQTDGFMRPGPALVIQHFKDAVATLSVGEDQKLKIDAIFADVKQKGLALSQELGDTPPEQRYQKLIDFAKQIRQQLAGVLNDDQMALLDDKAGANSLPRPANRQPGGGQGAIFIESLQQAINKLDLTDDQKQQIKDIVADAKQKITDIRQKAINGDNVQPDLQNLRQSLRTKLAGILSPDQLQSLQQSIQQYRQEHGGPGGPGQQPGRGGNKAPVAEMKPEDLT